MTDCKYCQNTGVANLIGPVFQVWAFGCICARGRTQRLTPWNGQITQEYRGNLMRLEFADEFPELTKRAESGYSKPIPVPTKGPEPDQNCANGYVAEYWDGGEQ